MHHRVYPLIVHIKGRGKRRGLEPLFLPAVQRIDFARVAAGAYIPPGAKGTSQSRRWQNTTQDAKDLDLSVSTPYVRDKSHQVKAFFWSKAVFLDDPEKRASIPPKRAHIDLHPPTAPSNCPHHSPLDAAVFFQSASATLALQCQQPGQGGSLSCRQESASLECAPTLPHAPPR